MKNKDRVHKLRELCEAAMHVINKAEGFVVSNMDSDRVNGQDVVNAIDNFRNLERIDFVPSVINPDES